MNKLPNIVVKSNQYWFQKKWPKDIKSIINKTSYTKKLNLAVSDTNPSTLERARTAAEELFYLKVKMYRNSCPESLRVDEIAKLVVDELASRNLSAGELEGHVFQEEFIEDDYTLNSYKLSKATEYIPEAESIDLSIALEGRLESDLSTHEQVILMARSALLNRKLSTPTSLENLWEVYYKYHELHLKSPREVSKRRSRWERFSSYVGITHLNETSISSDINPALKEYVHFLVNKRNVKASTVDRYLNDIIAILNYGSDYFEFNWRIKKPKFGKVINEPRIQYGTKEQVMIVQHCYSLTGQKAMVGVCILLYLQGGMMPSEIKRLRADDIQLLGKVPFLSISQTAKTKDRQRVVPVVFGLSFVNQYLGQTIEWLNKTTESNSSKQIQKMLREIVPYMPKQTAHCLRHTFEHNVVWTEANRLNSALIAGWSGDKVGVSDRMLKYGMGDMLNTEYLRSLYSTSKTINKHLIDI